MTDYLHEKISIEVLLSMILKADPERKGVCIDVGAGKKDFYFPSFSQSGYRSLVIEPLPTVELAEALALNQDVDFVQAALGPAHGTRVTLYRGRHGNDDLSSIDPSWWANDPAREAIEVEMISLDQLRLGPITALKIDVEGAEWGIISTLPRLPAKNLPRVLQFEFGGDTPRSSGENGWAPYLQEQLHLSLATCFGLGYSDFVVIPSHVAMMSGGVLDASMFRTVKDCMSIFNQDAVFGNIILRHRLAHFDVGGEPWIE